MRVSLTLWAVACLGVGLVAELLGLLDVLELRTYDLRAAHRAQRATVSPELAIVAVDSRSEEALGPFPWPHGAHLALAKSLERLEARGVFFVLDFRHSDPKAEPWDVSIPIYVVQPYTRVLSQTRRSAPWVGETATIPTDVAAAQPRTSFSVYPPSQEDGVYRYFQAVVRYGLDKKDRYSLEVLLASEAAGAAPESLDLPLDNTGRLLMGSGGAALPTASFIDVLMASEPTAAAAATVRDRWVVVGIREPHADRIRTPYGAMTALDVRVAAINSMLTSDLVRPRTSTGSAISFAAWAVVLAAVAWWIGGRLISSLAIGVIGFSAAIAHVLAAAALFEWGAVWQPAASPVVAITGATFAWVLVVGSARLRAVERRAFQAEREAAFGVMSAQMRHEIRNLLNAIASPAETIRRNFACGDPLGLRDRPEDMCKEMTAITDRTSELSEMIERELSFFQPESFRLVPGDLWGPAVEARDVLAEQLEQARAAVHADAPEERLTVHVDAEKMRVVFVNLIRNAMQAMPDGGMLSLKYGETRSGLGRRRAVVTVSDMGVGMDAEQLEHLFEPFYTTKARGLGLGLLNAKLIIDAHGGRIVAVSEKGRGSSVSVSLPQTGRNALSPPS